MFFHELFDNPSYIDTNLCSREVEAKVISVVNAEEAEVDVTFLGIEGEVEDVHIARSVVRQA